MAAGLTDLFRKVGAGTVTSLAAPGKALAAESINVGATTNYPTTTGIIIAIREVDTNGELVSGTYTEWKATVSSATALVLDPTPVYGDDQVYAAGSTTQVFIPTSASAQNDLIDGILVTHNQDGTLKTGIVTTPKLDVNLLAGWMLLIAAGTRVGDTSFDITGDFTAQIAVGDKIKLTDTTTKYYYVTAVAYSAPNTLITVTGGTDYIVVGNPSNIYYSKSESPVGFPQWFDYTPVFTGFSTDPTVSVSRFCINGRLCHVDVACSAGDSNATEFTVTLPLASVASTWTSLYRMKNNNAYVAGSGQALTSVGVSKVLNCYPDGNAGVWVATAGKTASFNFSYEI